MNSKKPKPSRRKRNDPALDTRREYSKPPTEPPRALSAFLEWQERLRGATDLRVAGQRAAEALVDARLTCFSGALLFVREEARALLRGLGAAISDGTPERRELQAFAARVELPLERKSRHALTSGLEAGEKGLIVAGAAAQELRQALEPALLGERFWILPIAHGERPQGVAVLGTSGRCPPNRQSADVARGLLSQLGLRIALEAGRARRELLDTGRTVVGETIQRGLNVASLGELLKTVTRGSARACSASRAFIWTWNATEEQLQRVAETTLQGDESSAEAAEAADALARLCLERRSVLRLPDLRAERSLGLTGLLHAVPAIVAPLVAFGETLGVVAVLGCSVGRGEGPRSAFGEAEEEFLGLLAGHAAMAIQTSRLYERRRAAERRLAETQETLLQHEKLAALGELSGRLAQEIRNPLVAMGGFARRIEHDLDPDDPQRENAALIAAEARRLEELLEQQIEMAQAAAPRMALHQLNELVQECVGQLRDEIVTRGALFEETYSDRLPDLLLDRQRMRQVIVNVLRNALGYISEGDTIRVETYRQRDRALLEVAHSGEKPGGELIEEVFAPFETRQPSGSGLGLALAHQIVKEHGGEISVRSEGEWSAVFTIAIPIWSNRERRKLRDRRRGRDRRKRS
ncbi:MAG: GAF domain-containing protein [Candidatus Eisenbacteria bacterium]|nr:GAF domain-containing protein [Candidatus Eisenbacteria bacterium]